MTNHHYFQLIHRQSNQEIVPPTVPDSVSSINFNTYIEFIFSMILSDEILNNITSKPLLEYHVNYFYIFNSYNIFSSQNGQLTNINYEYCSEDEMQVEIFYNFYTNVNFLQFPQISLVDWQLFGF
jgi:hypothetical protein